LRVASPSAAGPLSRFKVLDLTRVRSGPTAVRQFADWGADVLMVEARDQPGDLLSRDGSDFQNLNRNKRSIGLNLKSPAGREVLYRLVARSDLLVENFRPGVTRRLGFDYATLHALNPRLVYASISGFGQEGPYAGRPGYDQIAQGMGGLMTVTGEPGGLPLRAGIAVADSSAGLYCAIGALTALIEREVTGIGRWVTTSLLQAQIAMMDFQAARYLADGTVPEQTGNHHPTAGPMGLFATADGTVNIGAADTSLLARFCKVAGAEWILSDERFANPAARRKNRRALDEEVERITRTRSSNYWIEALNGVGVACGPVYRMDEMFADPHVRSLAMAKPIEHGRLGTIKVIGQPFDLSGAQAVYERPAPDLGEDTDSVLAELGYSLGQVAELRRDGTV
jgi:crotonobetainyl-CoA:carnitine CoA-transferase CaiB-like acyl-CoA transferase